MAVIVDPFSLVTAELSEEYIRVFPHPDIVPKYLETVSSKASVQLLSGLNSFSIKGSWLSVERAHSFLKEFLASYQSAELDLDTELVVNEALQLCADDTKNYASASSYSSSSRPSNNHIRDYSGEQSDWVKWTAEVLPQIHRVRAKREAKANKVPEPLVLFANFQPTSNPSTKKVPTLDAIEKELKKVYVKDKAPASPPSCQTCTQEENRNEAQPTQADETTEPHKKSALPTFAKENVADIFNDTMRDFEKYSVNSLTLSTPCSSLKAVAGDSGVYKTVTSNSGVDSADTGDIFTTDISSKDSLNISDRLVLPENLQDVTEFCSNGGELMNSSTGESDLYSKSECELQQQLCAEKEQAKLVKSKTSVKKRANVPVPLPATFNESDTDNKKLSSMCVSLAGENSVKKRGRSRNGKQTKSGQSEVLVASNSVSKLSSRLKRSVGERKKAKTEIASPGSVKASPTAQTVKQGRSNKPRTKNAPNVLIHEEETFPCKLCSYVAKKASTLRQHKRRMHTTKDFKCDVCGKVFGYEKDLKRHCQTHQKPDNCCDICGKMYKGIRTLAEHKKTHDSDYVKPEFPCEFCKKVFSTKYVLSYHIKAEHLGMKKTYLCPICGKSFSQRNSYLKHANVHMGIKPYRCDICGKSFSYEKSLKEHKYMHIENKQFECPVCQKKFRQSSGVAIHMKIHKKHKDYVCSACGKGFSQKQALIRHERIHLGEKPFACALCRRTFTDSSILRRHMILIHKKDPKKWREDTENNVQRHTDFFIKIVGDEGKTKKGVSRQTSLETQNWVAQNEKETKGLTDSRVVVDDHHESPGKADELSMNSDFDFLPVAIGTTRVVSIQEISELGSLDSSANTKVFTGTDCNADAVADPERRVDRLRVGSSGIQELKPSLLYSPSCDTKPKTKSSEVHHLPIPASEALVSEPLQTHGLHGTYAYEMPAPSTSFYSQQLQQDLTLSPTMSSAHYSVGVLPQSHMLMMQETLASLSFPPTDSSTATADAQSQNYEAEVSSNLALQHHQYSTAQ